MIKKIVMFIAALLLLFPLTVKADEYGELDGIIPDEVREVMEEMDIYSLDTETAASFSVADFMSAIIPNIEKNIKTPLKSLSGIFCVLLIAAVLNILKRSDGGSKTYDIAVAAVCALCTLAPVSQAIIEIAAVIQALTDFMLGYAPIYTGLMIASGTPTAAATYSSALIITGEVFSQLSDKTIVPLTGMVLGISVLSGVSSNEIFVKLPSAAKGITRWLFVTVTSLFVGLLSAQTAIASAGDTLLLKSGKMFAGFVPVVGSSLSEAFNVTVGSMSVVKSGVGIFGIIVILIIFIPPLIKMIIWTGGIRLMTAASDTLGTKGMKNVLSGVADALDMLIAVYASVGVIFVISTAVMIKVAV